MQLLAKQSDIKSLTPLPPPIIEFRGRNHKADFKSSNSAQSLQQHKLVLFFLFMLAHNAYSQQSPQKMQPVLLAKSGRAFSAVAWSPEGTFASAWNTSVLIWNASNNTIAAVCGGHTEQVTSVSFSNNGHYMLTSSDDGSVITYNLKNEYSGIRILPKNESNPTRVQSAAFSANSSSIFFSRDGTSVTDYLYLILTDKISTTTYNYSGHTAKIYSVRTAKTGNHMLTAAEDGTAILWDTQAHKKVRQYEIYAAGRIPALLAPNGTAFLSATSANTITLRALDGTERLSITEPLLPVNCATFTDDGAHFALALQGGDIAMYNTQSGVTERVFSTAPSRGAESSIVCSLAFSPDGEYLVAGTENGCLFIWSVNGKPIAAPAAPYTDSKIYDVILNRAEEMPEQDYNPETDEHTPATVSNNTQTQAVQKQQEGRASENGQGADNAASAQSRAVQTETSPAAPKTSPIPRHQMSVLAGVTSQPSKYFTPSIELDVEYRSFAFYPLYFGGAIALGDALPSKDYPYTYQVGGQLMRQPSMYRVGTQGMAGIAYYFERIQMTAIMEVRAGMSMRKLWNTQFKPSATTRFYLSANAGLGIGFLWHGVTGRFGVEYDTKFEFLYSGYIGYSFRLGRKSK